MRVSILSGICFAADGAFGGACTTIGGVQFYGGKMLDRIDFSEPVRDRDTLADGAVFLCRVYDEPARAIETYNYDRIANFELFCENSVQAVLSDYPGAAAPIEPDTYVLFSPRGNLFDDVAYYAFTAKDYYCNASPDAGGLAPARVGLPAFDDIAVTRSEGETVYEMQMTLDPELAAFYDAVDPDAQIEIECKYGYASDDTFATIAARPASYDMQSGISGSAAVGGSDFCPADTGGTGLRARLTATPWMRDARRWSRRCAGSGYRKRTVGSASAFFAFLKNMCQVRTAHASLFAVMHKIEAPFFTSEK